MKKPNPIPAGLVRTDYAIYCPAHKTWAGMEGKWTRSFNKAALFKTRPTLFPSEREAGCIVVAVRCRPLRSVKRNVRRNR